MAGTVKNNAAITQSANKYYSAVAWSDYPVGTSYKKFTSGDPGYSYTHYADPEFYSWGVAAIWLDSYDVSQLNNYTVSDVILRFKTKDYTNAGAEIVLLPSGITSASSAQAIYDAVMSGTVIYTYPTAYAANTDIFIPIADKDTLKLILQRGIGIRKNFTQNESDYIYGAGTANAPYIEFDYLDSAVPPVVSATHPKSQTVIANDDIVFTWSYSQEASEPQTHYDLQYSADNGITWTTHSNKVASSDHSCTISGGTLSSGTYLWRVRAWALSGTIVSEWSQAAFIAKINPVTSGVTCDGKPMPTISWTASEQQAFQIRFGDYDTGTIFSSASSYKIPKYFNNNAYAVTMRTQNNFGVWSDWTTIFYTQISNTPGAAITLSTWQAGYGVGLSWATTGTYTAYYVYRDGVPIVCVTGTSYVDDKAAGDCKYQIRGILTTGYYTLSNEAPQSIKLPFDIISPIDDIAWQPLKYSLGSPVSRAYGENDGVSYLYFAGREKPVPARAGQRSRRGNLRYAFKTRAEVDALRKLTGKTVIYKDSRGNRIIGVMNDVSETVSGKLFDTTFSVTQTDYNEAVTYD